MQQTKEMHGGHQRQLRSFVSMNVRHPALHRILADHGEDASQLLTETLSGADLTVMLLEAARRRAEAKTPKDVLAQYERDRFVRPSMIDGRRQVQMECAALDAIGRQFDVLTLSPLSPLGTHSVIAGVNQNRIVTTMRGTEVAADPTNGLALEAAVRRRELIRNSQRTEQVRLACVQRATRAQQFDGPLSFAHFSLLAAVIAGRDTGSLSWERTSLVEMLRALSHVCLRAGASEVSIGLTDFDGSYGPLLDEVAGLVASEPVFVRIDRERSLGRGYYPSICFNVHVRFGGEEVEVGDGGIVPWTQRLLSNAKERLLIGGIGLDRLTTLAQ
jgi:hypothetical protein